MNFNKILRVRGTQAIVVTALVVTNASEGTAAPAQILRTWANARCPVIGRLMSLGDVRFAVKSLLCKGDRLHPTNGFAVVKCFDTRREMRLKGHGVVDIAQKCGSPQVRLYPCSPKNPKNCFEYKGPTAANHLIKILNPIEGALKDGRPNFSWAGVPEATSYTVDVAGPGANWLKTVKATSLNYPSTEGSMQHGNAYAVTVVAYRGKNPIKAGKAILNILSSNEVQQLNLEIEQVKYLQLAEDEAVLDLNMAYLSRNLQDKAVKLLQSQIKEGTNNPAVYSTLGDRYLEANLPDLALSMYKQAEAIAPENSWEQARARAGIENINKHY